MGLTYVTTQLLAPSSLLLTSLAAMKQELNIPSGDTTADAQLNTLIANISAAIAYACNRTFQQQTVRDDLYPERDAYPYQIPGGVAPLQLTAWPVAPAIVATTAAATAAQGATTFTVASAAGIVVGQPVSTPAIGAAGPVPLGAYVAGISGTTVTLSTALTASLASASAVAFGPVVVVTDPPGTPTLLVQGTDYLVRDNGNSGQLIRLNHYTQYPSTWDPVQTTVVYQGGFATVPLDIQDAMLRAVTQRYTAAGRDPLLKSQGEPGLGQQQWWIGTMPGVRGAWTEEIADLIYKYRVPTVA